MKPIIEDFVNRTDQLALLWDIVDQKAEHRILVVEAEGGMGKTYLFKEFRAECLEGRLEGVSLDFDARYEDPGYMYVIKETWNQLGSEGFDQLAKTIEQTVAGSLRRNGEQGWQDLQSARQPAPKTMPELAGEPAAAAASSLRGSSPINVSGETINIRDVAGRDINYFIQVIHREDPYVQIQAQNWITEAFRQCLIQVTAERRIVFFIDHWQKAETETRRWLANSLVKWAADGLLAKACVVIAGLQGVDLEPRRLLKRIPLDEFDDEAIQFYLVNICGVPVEEVPNFTRFAGGMPYLLNAGVKRWNRERRPR